MQHFTGQNVGIGTPKHDGIDHAAREEGTHLARPQGRIDTNGRLSVCGSIAARIVEIADADPKRIALRAGEGLLTYAELVARASCLATRLKDLGIKEEVPVGICLPRSFDRIAAMLATWFAEGAFIPLDPEWPANRMRDILEEAGASVVVADVQNDLLNSPRQIAVPASDQFDHQSRFVSVPRGTESRLAYVIYTSGSTGKPKGVEITHANLSNLIAWHIDAFKVTSADRACSLSGLGFDANVWEIWPYLVAGASISLVDEESRTSARQLKSWLVREQVTIAFVPTPLAETMMREPWPSETALRRLLTGGDALHSRPLPELPFTVVNNYGPTECTVVATSSCVPPSTESIALPSIGKPIAGASVWILDPDGCPVPDGTVGELCIEGACVGRGYRGRPDLTSERFFQFVSPAGKILRLYKTGDLGSLLPNGEIAFHGRLDTQTKVRGHRVETDEIATVLNRHHAVTQSAVTISGSAEQGQLTAYVVPHANEKPHASSMRDLLIRSLPEYMVPSRFILVDALPLTSNGKIDRTALPEPTEKNVLRDAPYRAPQTVTEERLATMMADLLGIEPIGADDNFFLLGGHSLLGSQLALRVREAFGANVTLRDVFRTQTVSRLAARIEELIVARLQSLTEEEAQKLAAE